MKTRRTELARARRLPAAPGGNVGLGRLLMSLGKGELAAFCDEVNLNKRKAYHLIEIVQAVEEGRMREADVEAIGWTKAQAIVSSRPTAAQAKRAVTFAACHTVAELEAYMATGESARRVPRIFHLTEKEAAELDALLLANGAERARRGIVKREAALMAVVRAASRNLNSEGGQATAPRAGQGQRRQKSRDVGQKRQARPSPPA